MEVLGWCIRSGQLILQPLSTCCVAVSVILTLLQAFCLQTAHMAHASALLVCQRAGQSGHAPANSEEHFLHLAH